MSGLQVVIEKSDWIVTIDADSQDDPAVILDFVQAFKQGYELIYGVRKNSILKKGSTLIKIIEVELFSIKRYLFSYRLLNI